MHILSKGRLLRLALDLLECRYIPHRKELKVISCAIPRRHREQEEQKYTVRVE